MMFSDLLVIEFNARSRDLILLHRENKIMIEASVTELEEARLTFSIFLVIPKSLGFQMIDGSRKNQLLLIQYKFLLSCPCVLV